MIYIKNVFLLFISIYFIGCSSLSHNLKIEKKEMIDKGYIPNDKYFIYKGKEIGKYGNGVLGQSKPYFINGRYGPKYILVSVTKGELNFFGKMLEYKPKLFRLNDGETKYIGIKSKGSNFLKTFISVSFVNGVFKFDLEAKEPYEIPFHPTWFRSASYFNLKNLKKENSKSAARDIQFSIYGPR